MKANLQTALLTAVVAGALPLAAGATDNDGHDRHHSSYYSPIVNAVREVVLNFTREEVKKYGLIARTPCVTGPEFGAMGVHLINLDNMDGILDINKPEALIYEPQANGRLRLVGVEYIVPKPAWDALHADPLDRPQLQGHLLNFVGEPNRYGLPGFYEIHVWAFEDNPKGALTDWNPEVTCEKQRLPR
jgi:hypothetical protein